MRAIAWSAAALLSGDDRAQADRLGEYLAGIKFRADAIITSPKVRAAQTAELVAGHLGVGVSTDDRLADALDLATLEGVLTDVQNPERVVIVGHDPDFSEVVAKGIVLRTDPKGGSPVDKGGIR